MITKDEYLRALDVVLEYHREIEFAVKMHAKTSMNDWLKDKKVSTRLDNILHQYDYVEDVTRYNFLQRRSAGKTTWSEFEKLRK